MSTSKNDPRATMRTIIAENRDLITENLNAMVHRNAEDMVAAGIARTKVADALFTVAVTHQLLALRRGKLIDLLRDLADHFERELMNSPQIRRTN